MPISVPLWKKNMVTNGLAMACNWALNLEYIGGPYAHYFLAEQAEFPHGKHVMPFFPLQSPVLSLSCPSSQPSSLKEKLLNTNLHSNLCFFPCNRGLMQLTSFHHIVCHYSFKDWMFKIVWTIFQSVQET